MHFQEFASIPRRSQEGNLGRLLGLSLGWFVFDGKLGGRQRWGQPFLSHINSSDKSNELILFFTLISILYCHQREFSPRTRNRMQNKSCTVNSKCDQGRPSRGGKLCCEIEGINNKRQPAACLSQVTCGNVHVPSYGY